MTMTALTSTFVAAGVTVTPNVGDKTITFSDTQGRSIVVGLARAADIADEIREGMSEGITEQRLHAWRGCRAVFSHDFECGDRPCPPDGPYVEADGSVGLPVGADASADIWAISSLYTGIHAAVAGIKSEPLQEALRERLGITGYIAANVIGTYELYVSSMDAAAALDVDEAALLTLGRLGLLGNAGLSNGSIRAVDLLRALGHSVPRAVP